MKRLAVLVPLVPLAWAAAPAVSLSPYVPDPVEFEQPLRGVVERVEPKTRVTGESAHSREGPVRYLSAPIRAPHRFDAVGVAGEMRTLEFRVREAGGKWSSWVETDNGDPVWAGGAEYVQVRSRSIRPRGVLHYVNVSGTATGLDRALTSVRGAVSSALISVAAAAELETEPPKPDVKHRSWWDPGHDCPPRTGPAYGSVKAAAVHHTVSANDYGRDEVPGMVRAICLFHRNGNGWNDIGYNALVDRFGRPIAGRAGGLAHAVIGAHAQGVNAQTTGVASLGMQSKVPISDPAMQGFVRLLAWKLAHHGSPAKGKTTLVSAGGSVSKYPAGTEIRVPRIFGHRRVNYTACPGDALRDQLRELRDRAQRRIDRFSDGSGGGGIPPLG